MCATMDGPSFSATRYRPTSCDIKLLHAQPALVFQRLHGQHTVRIPATWANQCTPWRQVGVKFSRLATFRHSPSSSKRQPLDLPDATHSALSGCLAISTLRPRRISYDRRSCVNIRHRTDRARTPHRHRPSGSGAPLPSVWDRANPALKAKPGSSKLPFGLQPAESVLAGGLGCSLIRRIKRDCITIPTFF